MWHVEHTEHTSAPPQAVWSLWSDVATWPEWDEGVREAALEGPFASGTRGRLKPRSGPSVSFTLADVEPNARFATEARLPLARMRFDHRANRDGERTRVTHSVEISGPLGPLFARLIGRGAARDLPQAVRGVVARAERG